jgi:hypothetical protein
MEILNCLKLNLTIPSHGMFYYWGHIDMAATLTVPRRYFRVPKPFNCAIKPRSDDAIKLVKEVYGRMGN